VGTQRTAWRKHRGSRATRRTRAPRDEAGRGRKLPGTLHSPTPPAPIPDAARVYPQRRHDRTLPRMPCSPTPSPSGPRIPDAACTCSSKTPSDATAGRSSTPRILDATRSSPRERHRTPRRNATPHAAFPDAVTFRAARRKRCPRPPTPAFQTPSAPDPRRRRSRTRAPTPRSQTPSAPAPRRIPLPTPRRDAATPAALPSIARVIGAVPRRRYPLRVVQTPLSTSRSLDAVHTCSPRTLLPDVAAGRRYLRCAFQTPPAAAPRGRCSLTSWQDAVIQAAFPAAALQSAHPDAAHQAAIPNAALQAARPGAAAPPQAALADAAALQAALPVATLQAAPPSPTPR
jgi:hypothetical protein